MCGQGDAQRLPPGLHKEGNVFVQQSHHADFVKEFKCTISNTGRILGAELQNCQHKPTGFVMQCSRLAPLSVKSLLSVIDLHDVCHTLWSDKESQQYCGIIPYSGSQSYQMMCLLMGSSLSPAVWIQSITKVMTKCRLKRMKSWPRWYKMRTKSAPNTTWQ